VLVRSPRPFQIMRPDAMTDAKLSTCSRTWRDRSYAVSSSSSFATKEGGSTCRQPRRRIDLSSSVNIGGEGKRERLGPSCWFGFTTFVMCHQK